MSVRKRAWITGKGEAKEAWVVDYKDAQGERHIETYSTKKEARDRESEINQAVKQGTHTPASKSLTIAEAADKWLRRIEASGKERSTVAQYRQHIDRHIVPRIGTRKAATIGVDGAEAFRDSLVAELSRPLARKVLTSFKSILKEIRMSHIADGVSIDRDKRKDRKLEDGRDFPTPKEVKRLIEAVKDNPRQHAILLTACLTGLRASELRGLRWRDIDLASSELHVRQRADRYNVIGAPKSHSSARTVPMPPELVAALKVWKLQCPPNPGDLAFPTAKGKIEDHKTMLRALGPVMVKAGLSIGKGEDAEPKYGMHSFRHFFASWCINPMARGGRQLPPKEVQTLLGHSSIVMTLDTYGHLFPRGDDAKELAAASAALFA